MELMTITAIGLAALAVIVIVLVKTGKSEAAADLPVRGASFIGRNGKSLILSALTVVFTLGFLYYFYTPLSEGIGPIQPIPFSHRVHAGVKAIDCKFCHPYVAQSLFPGIPPVEKCLYCHNYIITQHPWIKKEHQYYNTGTPTPWAKVNYVPEHVLFNHQRHIKKEIACEQCHGKVETMDRLQQRHYKMGFCIECHRTRQAPLDCWLSCHS